MIFGDTVPTAGFHAAGMTFEKESGDPIVDREHEQFTSMWASLVGRRRGRAARSSPAGTPRASRPYQQGVAGELEANASSSRSHELYQPVPDVTRPRTTSCATTRTGPTSCSCSSGACSGWTSRSTS